ncbi:hypothetical protein EUTSA_v10021861mg [Eutrema salsugineum]|uniref:Uncharacterized protein n=1 Tax=Eutrema salsugineum TaxID=72664 RepID=V4LUY3_EUTSA|nr:hypothetical protein EUTSA_v10021861mg [Eutrema salsugineum]
MMTLVTEMLYNSITYLIERFKIFFVYLFWYSLEFFSIPHITSCCTFRMNTITATFHANISSIISVYLFTTHSTQPFFRSK